MKEDLGVKFDKSKLRYDLIDSYALYYLAKVYTYGAFKYEENNWRRGLKWSRVFGALMRHAWAFWRGEVIDKESGLPHLAHAAWNCFTLLNYTKTNKAFDDRPRESMIEEGVIFIDLEEEEECVSIQESKCL